MAAPAAWRGIAGKVEADAAQWPRTGGSTSLPRGGAAPLPRATETGTSESAGKTTTGAGSMTQPQGGAFGQSLLPTAERKFGLADAGQWRRPEEGGYGVAGTLGTQAASVALNRTDSTLAALSAMVDAGLERPRSRQRPPFQWLPSSDYETEFEVSGRNKEIVTKVGDYRDRSWVIPVGSTLQLMKGASYRWTLRIEHICPHQPQMQLGIHGAGHRRPWRLLTTTRCSRARDDEPWRERPEGDHAIQEGDFVHFEVDLRGLHLPFGTMSIAINTGSPEIVFDDIPLSASTPVMPVVSMGGDQSRVRLCPAY